MHFSKISGVKISLLAALTISSSMLFAQPAQGSGQGGGQGNGQGNGPGQPPAEALQACKSLSSGQDCSFTGNRGAVTGTCWAPEGKPLACKLKDAGMSKDQGKK